MKLDPITKLDWRNTVTSKNTNDDVMLANCDISVFPIYG